jgi:integrase
MNRYLGKVGLARVGDGRLEKNETAFAKWKAKLPLYGENPKVIQELLHDANLKVTMDTYVQAVSDEKRKAQSKVVEMLLPGIHRAVI